MSEKTKEEITKELKSGTRVNQLKIQRNMGEATPEVIEMCKLHVDQMLDAAKQLRKSKMPELLEEAAEQIKNDQELLLAVSEFTDRYVEVLGWNHLIRMEKLDKSVTLRHREADLAFFEKRIIEVLRQKNLSPAIYTLMYEYGWQCHRSAVATASQT